MSQGDPATPVPEDWIDRLVVLTKFMFTFNAGMLVAVPAIVQLTHNIKIGGTEFAIFIGACVVGILNASASLIILLTKAHASEGALHYGAYAVARNLTMTGITIGLIALLFSADSILHIVYKSGVVAFLVTVLFFGIWSLIGVVGVMLEKSRYRKSLPESPSQD